eukprot:4053592-Prymnesium_polylepis.1
MTHVLPVVTASLRSFKARSLKKKLLESRKTQMCAVPSVLSASCHKSVVRPNLQTKSPRTNGGAPPHPPARSSPSS